MVNTLWLKNKQYNYNQVIIKSQVTFDYNFSKTLNHNTLSIQSGHLAYSKNHSLFIVDSSYECCFFLKKQGYA